MRPRSRGWLRWLLLALALVVLLPLGAVAAFLLTFDADAYRPRIETAVEAATGRDLAIGGPVRTKLSLVPTITLQDVALANPPGFSRPTMLAARRMQAEVALLPLLSRRVEIRRVLLDGADLLLERDAGGRGNWVFEPAAPNPAPAPAPALQEPAGPRDPPFALSVGSFVLADSALGWRASPAAPVQTLSIQRLAAEVPAPGEGLRLSGRLGLGPLAIALDGETGPPSALLSPPAAAGTTSTVPWPLRVVLSGDGGLRLGVEGSIGDPVRRRGYRLALTAAVPQLEQLAPLLPDAPLPPLRQVEATATLAEAEGAPAFSDLRLVAGEGPLQLLHPGLRLESLALALPRLAGPLSVDVAARLGATPFMVEGQTGSPLRLIAPAPGAEAWPVVLRASLGEARLSIEGTIADPRALTGADLALAARVPSLAVLAPLLPRGAAGLPRLHDIALDTRLSERGPRFAAGAVLQGLRLTTSAGDLEGDLTWVIGTRQGLTGSLRAARLDLDALLAAPGATAGPAATPVAGTLPGSPPGRPSAPPQATAAAAPAGGQRIIPDMPLPLGLLRLTDSDLRLQAGVLRAAGAEWREFSVHAVVEDGRGRLDPLVANVPGGGRVTLRAAADATAARPVAQLALEGEGLDVAALQATAGMPARATGRLSVTADLRGSGADLRSLAAGAHGHLGLTLQDGSVPQEVIEDALAVLRRQVPGLAELAGRRLELGCVAARLDAREGIARPRVLLAETSLGRVGAGEGAGTLSLRDETLDLRLNTDLRLPVPGLGAAGLRIRAPVPLTGTLAAPRLEWNAAAGTALAGEVADRVEQALGPGVGQGVGQLLGVLGGTVAGGARGAAQTGVIPDCPTALAVARGRPRPTTPAAQAPPPEAPAAPAVVAPAPTGPAPAPAPQGPRPLRDPADAVQQLRRQLPGLFGR